MNETSISAQDKETDMKALFMRHKPTTQQLKEIGRIDHDFTELASRDIKSLEEAEAIWSEMVQKFKGYSVWLHGVFPAPLMNCLYREDIRDIEDNPEDMKLSVSLVLFSAFNINRAPEGEKPKFEHICWVPIAEF